LSKVANFNLPLGVTPSEFCQDLRHQKTRVPGLSCGVVCMILRLAVSVEHQHVTDRQAHNDGIYCATTASHGENYPQKDMR